VSPTSWLSLIDHEANRPALLNTHKKTRDKKTRDRLRVPTFLPRMKPVTA